MAGCRTDYQQVCSYGDDFSVSGKGGKAGWGGVGWGGGSVRRSGVTVYIHMLP